MRDALVIFRLQSPAWQFWIAAAFGAVVILVLIVVVFIGPELYHEARDVFFNWLPAKPEPDDAVAQAERRRLNAVVSFPQGGRR